MWTSRHRLVTRVGALQRESDRMAWEPISPELALVDPDLGARARAALADPVPATYAPRPVPSPTQAPRREHRPYPFWARVTAALWLLVLGILVGGDGDPARAGHSTRRSAGRGRTLLQSAWRDARPARRSPAGRRERPGGTDAPLAGRGDDASEPRLQSGALGAIAQLGERLDRTQEVASSSLASSTKVSQLTP